MGSIESMGNFGSGRSSNENVKAAKEKTLGFKAFIFSILTCQCSINEEANATRD